ncbi:MAG TPA: 3-oxoacyl-[acyl-carrier-protein] reductase [Thermoanaerobaculia bacterium]|nr:3-oxoacyl-[acyl-carrier-protein] reductase [Thermoanaerobaculia bacterium]
MNPFRLDGRLALVTGASQGIGETIARRLAAQGARVVLAARNEEKLASVADSIREEGGQCLPFRLDLARAAEIGSRLKELPAEWGDVGILVNNAGVTADNLLLRMSLEQWQTVIDTNLTGTFAVTKEIARGMIRQRWGRVVTVSSVVGLMGNAGQANYGAAKAGLIGFTKSIARELASRNITANVVAPGFVETAMTTALPEAVRTRMLGDIPLGRFGAAEEIAAAVAYLASEEAAYVTGQVLNVSGGLYI